MTVVTIRARTTTIRDRTMVVVTTMTTMEAVKMAIRDLRARPGLLDLQDLQGKMVILGRQAPRDRPD
jgi:hypothetical protein